MDVLLPQHTALEEVSGNHRLVEHVQQPIADAEQPQSPQEARPALCLPV